MLLPSADKLPRLLQEPLELAEVVADGVDRFGELVKSSIGIKQVLTISSQRLPQQERFGSEVFKSEPELALQPSLELA